MAIKPENHGGITSLLQITDPYDLTPPGEYKDQPDYKVTCV